MKNTVIVILTFILTIFLTALIPFILWPLFFLAYFFIKDKNKVKIYGLAFLYGLVVDLVTGQWLGISSIVLLLFALALYSLSVRLRVDIKAAIVTGIFFEILYLILINFIVF